jgi:hypothetical protein
MNKYLGKIDGAQCFHCLRPDHTDVYDEHVLYADHAALAARLAEAETTIEDAGKCLAMSNGGAREALIILRRYQQTADSASAEAYEDEELARMLKQEAKAHSATAEPKP